MEDLKKLLIEAIVSYETAQKDFKRFKNKLKGDQLRESVRVIYVCTLNILKDVYTRVDNIDKQTKKNNGK